MFYFYSYLVQILVRLSFISNLSRIGCSDFNESTGTFFVLSNRSASKFAKSVKITKISVYTKSLCSNKAGILPILKVVGNEKEGGSGKWQMIDIGLGLW
jgi:hypothetical protein